MTPPIKQNIIKSSYQKFLSEENRKIAYAIACTFGISVFFLYFAHINYTPKISLSDSAMLIFSAMFIGTTFIAVLSGLFILPTLIWTDTFGQKLRGMSTKESKLFLGLYQATPIAITFALFIYALKTNESTTTTTCIILEITTILFWVIILAAQQQTPLKNLAALASNIIVFIICIAVIITISLHGTADIEDKDTREIATNFSVFAAISLIITFNVAMTSSGKVTLKETVSGSLVLFILITLGTQSISAIPKGVMHILGRGSFEAEEIVLKKDICGYFSKKADDNTKNNDKTTLNICSLKNVWILWSGEETILFEIEKIKYQIDKKDVLAISTRKNHNNFPQHH